MSEEPPQTTPPTAADNGAIFLSDDPARLADFITHRKNADNQDKHYKFSEFLSDMSMTDFEDAYQIRATLESQAQLLGTAFNYLMIEGDWKNLSSMLRTQKIMRDTLELMTHYPSLGHMRAGMKQMEDLRTGQKDSADAALLE